MKISENQDYYLVSYKYKGKDGCLITHKTVTKMLKMSEISRLTTDNNYYENYIEILFCQKL